MPAFSGFYSMRSSAEVNRAVSEWKRAQLAVLLGMALKAVLCVLTWMVQTLRNMHTGVANSSENCPAFPPSPRYTTLSCMMVCFLQISVRCLLFSACSIAYRAGCCQRADWCPWKGRGASSMRSRQFFKLAYLNFKQGCMASVGCLCLLVFLVSFLYLGEMKDWVFFRLCLRVWCWKLSRWPVGIVLLLNMKYLCRNILDILNFPLEAECVFFH